MICKVDIGYTIANEIIDDILAESPDCSTHKIAEIAHERAHEHCDGLEQVIYYYKAIQFCAENDTSEGEAWLEDCGGMTQPEDTFGQIACRVAFATIYCETINQINSILDAIEEAA